MERIILHADCDSFYASVEECMDPSLRAVPMAVAGDPESRHGIILAKNQLAKAFHVQTAEPIWQAKRKCPDLVCVPPHHSRYQEVSRQINQIYLTYTDLVERYSIDESFLDVTGSLHLFGLSPRELADQLRRRVRQEVGVTISVGVSFCKVMAKLGSEQKKPNGTTVIMREDLASLVYPLPVEELLYVGHRTAQALHRLGIRTIGQLAAFDRMQLGAALGKAGEQLWRYANGLDDDPVASFYAEKPPKSVGNGMTFRQDLVEPRSIRAGISMLADSVAARLRADGLQCRVVQVQIKDPRLKVISRQKTLSTPTYLQRELVQAAMELLEANWPKGAPIRLLSVTATDLSPAGEACQQLSFFPQEVEARRQKTQRLEDAMAAIREKYGPNSIRYGPRDDALP